MYVTKFPGGGMEFGEGTIDCLRRECIEEFGEEVEVTGHYYTTDFFQVSAFNTEHQILSIYYRISCSNPERIKVSGKKFDFPEIKDNAQSLRWLEVELIGEEEFTFPIDKKVAEMLRPGK